MRVVHLPLQSGSNVVLDRMNRGYTVEQYKEKFSRIKAEIPDISIITDIMVGFSGETNEDFNQTVDIVRELEFDDINVFAFSMRQGTAASQKYTDDIPDSTKEKRMMDIIRLRDQIKLQKYQRLIGKETFVFNEGLWHKDTDYCYGRDHYLRTCVFKKNEDIPINSPVRLCILSATSSYLICECL